MLDSLSQEASLAELEEQCQKTKEKIEKGERSLEQLQEQCRKQRARMEEAEQEAERYWQEQARPYAVLQIFCEMGGTTVEELMKRTRPGKDSLELSESMGRLQSETQALHALEGERKRLEHKQEARRETLACQQKTIEERREVQELIRLRPQKRDVELCARLQEGLKQKNLPEETVRVLQGCLIRNCLLDFGGDRAEDETVFRKFIEPLETWYEESCPEEYLLPLYAMKKEGVLDFSHVRNYLAFFGDGADEEACRSFFTDEMMKRYCGEQIRGILQKRLTQEEAFYRATAPGLRQCVNREIRSEETQWRRAYGAAGAKAEGKKLKQGIIVSGAAIRGGPIPKIQNREAVFCRELLKQAARRFDREQKKERLRA